MKKARAAASVAIVSAEFRREGSFQLSVGMKVVLRCEVEGREQRLERLRA